MSTQTTSTSPAPRPSGGNVFTDIGVQDPDLQLTKARLADELARRIRQLRLTQAQAAERLGIDQPKISALTRGRFAGFSTDRLLRYLTVLGLSVDIQIQPPSRSRKKAELRVLRPADAPKGGSQTRRKGRSAAAGPACAATSTS